MMELLFLGTGGARFVTAKQLRKTGGIYLKIRDGTKKDTKHIYIDPGPGALVYALEKGVPLEKIDVIIATHAHTDHVNDLRTIIEAVTKGCTVKKGVLLTTTSVLEGFTDKLTNSINNRLLSDFHINALEKVVNLNKEPIFEYGGLRIEAITNQHSDPYTVSFKVSVGGLDNSKTLGFITDTGLFPELVEFFRGSDYLVINNTLPRGFRMKGHEKSYHLLTSDSATIVNAIKPKKAILTHFGIKCLFKSIKGEESWLREKVEGETQVIFARDFQRIQLGKHKKEKERRLDSFL